MCGEEDVFNVAQLCTQAGKWAKLWREGEQEWDIRGADFDLEGVEVSPLLAAEDLRRSA